MNYKYNQFKVTKQWRSCHKTNGSNFSRVCPPWKEIVQFPLEGSNVRGEGGSVV